MPLEAGEDGDKEVRNRLFRALQSPVRRRILFNLLEHNPQQGLLVPEDVHVGKKPIDQLNLELTHNHLPLMEQAGFIRWDRAVNQIHKGPEFDEISGLLRLIDEHEE